MTRFFFHVFDDCIGRDHEGLELADAQAARRQALAGARAMMCETVRQGRLDLRHRIEVEGEHGEEILTLRFDDAITIEPYEP